MIRSINDTEIQQLISGLESVPGRVAAALAAIPEDRLTAPGLGSGGSPVEILSHMRAAHAITAPRVFSLLVRESPRLQAFDDEAWRRVGRYEQLPIQDSLQALTLARAELIITLRHLPAGSWRRHGSHEVRGTVAVIDVLEDLLMLDQEYIRQLEALATGSRGW